MSPNKRARFFTARISYLNALNKELQPSRTAFKTL